MTTTVTGNNAPVSSFASNVKTNFQNMSTVKKVVLGLTAIALVGASVAAFVATPALIAFSAATLSFAVSALAVQLTAGGLGALGLAIPAFALIGSPKKNQESAVEMQEIQGQEEAEGPSAEDESVAPTPAQEPAVEQSSFSLSSFAYNHRYLLAGAVIVTAAVLGGAHYFGKDGMKAQGQNLVEASKNAFAQVYSQFPTFN